MWSRSRSWMEDSWLHSAVEVFNENSFTSGVWTNTATSLVPKVNIEQSMAGYLKMVGCLTNAQAIAKEVPTPRTVSSRRERRLT